MRNERLNMKTRSKRIFVTLLLLVAVTALAELATRTVGDAAATNRRLVSSGPCKLYAVTGINSGPDQFIQVFQTNALPANGAVPVFSVIVGGGQFYSFDFGTYGSDLDKVFICCSTTTNTLTLGSSNVSITAIIGR